MNMKPEDQEISDMNYEQSHITNQARALSHDYRWMGGAVLIMIGVLVFLDQFLHTGWLYLMIFPAIGLILLSWGSLGHRPGLIISGSILTGLGFGVFIFFCPLVSGSILIRIGFSLIAFGFGWILIMIASQYFFQKMAWWAMIPATVICATGACFAYSNMRVVDFVLYLVTSLGVMFLIWGIATRKIGLIIPGGILSGIGPGVFLGFGKSGVINGLTGTGIMLVYFGLGWVIISVLSIVVYRKFLWWPLIPGGIMAITGWSLYLGGDPHNAINFISNTGSLGLIIFGIYLLLWRWGFNNDKK
jgi:hypothetical protein